MKLKISSKGLGIVLGLTLASGMVIADPIVGTGAFGASGSVYVSATALDFSESAALPPGDQTALVNMPVSGSFAYLTPGTSIGMGNLNLSTATVTSNDINFDGAEPDFITLPPNATGGIDLSLTDIPINTSVPLCSTFTSSQLSDPNSGILCRAYSGSPIVLEQGPSGVTASLNLQGLAYYVGSDPTTGTPYVGKFSADASSPDDDTIGALLSTFNSTGSVTVPFTVDFFATAASTVPEPGTLTALGAGLLLVGLINKRKKGSKRSI